MKMLKIDDILNVLKENFHKYPGRIEIHTQQKIGTYMSLLLTLSVSIITDINIHNWGMYVTTSNTLFDDKKLCGDIIMW